MASSFRLSGRYGLVAACVVLLVLTASTASADPTKPPACPDSFRAQTVEDALVRLAGVLPEEQIRAGFASIDANGNGITCGKTFSPQDKKFPFQNVHDDQAKP
jgi:hypothetical protein